MQYPSNTCHNLIGHVTKLLLSTSHRGITWLWGPSGCGKSTIGFTLSGYFNSISRLAAYIHLDHRSESPFPIIGSITYKLATFDPEFRRIVAGFLEQRHEQLSIETQFKKYLLGPLREGAFSTAGPVVFIIDGLDESKNCEEFLQLLSSGIFSQLPQNFRFLIISSSITSSLFFNDSIYKIQLYENNDDTPITATTSSPQVSTPSSESEPVLARVFEPELLFDYFVVKKNIKFERKTFILCEVCPFYISLISQLYICMIAKIITYYSFFSLLESCSEVFDVHEYSDGKYNTSPKFIGTLSLEQPGCTERTS